MPAPRRAMSPQEALARLAAATFGRAQGPEYFYGYPAPMTAGTVVQTVIPRPLNLARPLQSITLMWSGRIVIGTADYTAGVPEAPQTLIENIQIQGTHVKYGMQTPINISGASAFAWQKMFMPFGNDLMIGTTRSADPGMPFAQTTGLTTGAQGTYDVRLIITIPVHPVFPPSPTSKRAIVPFLWRPQDWKNDLTLKITLGDKTSLGTPAGGTTVAFTSYGAATGNPQMDVFLNYTMLGAFKNAGVNALVIRSEQLINPALVAVASQTQLVNLQKQVTLNAVLKTGIGLTGMTAGANPFASLSDVQLNATKIIVDNKAIRDTYSNPAVKNEQGLAWGTVQPQGYLLLPFIDSMNPATALRGDTIPQGARFALVTDVLAANAANKQLLIQEQAIGGPYA